MYYLCKDKAEFEENAKRVIGHANVSQEYSLEVISENKGAPLNAMNTLQMTMKAKAVEAWLVNNDAKAFRHYCYVASKLDILAVSGRSYETFRPYQVYVPSSQNPYFHLFFILMSDAPGPIDFIIRNADQVFPDENRFNVPNVGHYMMTNIKLALLGEDWDLLRTRAQALLNDVPKRAKKWVAVFEFMVGLSTQDVEQMKAALNALLVPRAAKIAANNLLPYVDFFLQPQVLFYGKIASRYGYDLGIDTEIAPKALIEYAPLDEYTDPYDFMKEYDLSAPYEFQYEWIDRYTPKKNNQPSEPEEAMSLVDALKRLVR